MLRHRLTLVTLVLAVAVTALTLLPQAKSVLVGKRIYDLFPWAKLDESIPAQADVTGVQPGARPLRHDELLGYMEALAKASPRARLIDYGETHEGRRMVYLAISDEKTIANLDTFKTEHARRMDPRNGAGEATSGKAVAWMAYSIHGDELSGSDASASVAYWLIAGEDERVKKLRSELVILIDPCENPDGRDRYLAQTRSFGHKRPTGDLDDLSHTGVWPWGRGNHYLFDLNRDWFSMVHPESARSTVIASWNPQLVVDAHEMGSDDSYMFPPARHPFNPHLPSATRKWWSRFAEDAGAALDARGYAYYTREWNEEFFPGYGSSWAAYHGANGVLYEMSSTDGTLVNKRGGAVRTYAEAVEHQAVVSVANLETLASSREEVLKDFVVDRKAGIEAAKAGAVRAWVIVPGDRPGRADALAAALIRQGLEVQELAEASRATDLHDIRTGNAAMMQLPVGSYLVRIDQPSGRLARVLLDPHVPMETNFLQEEREYLERGRGTRLYETTAWSMALAYGADAYWTGKVPGGDWQPASTPSAEGTFQAGPDAVAWVIEGTTDTQGPALASLLQRGVRARVADRAFKVNGRDYPRGSVLINREENGGEIEELLTKVASLHPVAIDAVTTFLAESGPDLGGSHFVELRAPKVGVLSGSPVSPSDYGAVWHLLDEQLDLRFNAIDTGRVRGVDLSRYNVLVFPPVRGGTSAYRTALGKSGLDRLKQWIGNGGTAIGIGNAVDFLADKELGWTKTRLRRQALDRYPPVVWGIEAKLAEQAGPPRAVGVRVEGIDDDEEVDDNGNPGNRRPYDVAPVIGPGAQPFVAGVDLGTPVTSAPVPLKEWVKPLLAEPLGKAGDEMLNTADARLRRFASRGVMLAVDLDGDSYLSWGLPDSITVWSGSSAALMADAPVQVAARFADLDALHQGGLLWPEGAGRIALTAYTTRERVGRGQVVLFSSHPLFRGWMHDSRRLFVNALLYGPGVGTSWSTPW